MWSSIKSFMIVLAVCLLCMTVIYFLPVNEFAPITVEVSRESFTETAEAIDNPNRGLHSIYGFRITDREEDYMTLIRQMFEKAIPANLAMIQINLADYADGDLSAAGLKNIENLFAALRTKDHRWILRFTYDWEGKAISSEPESLYIIVRHMAQLKDLLQANADRIFVIQGLFIGNWGEMNGTRYNAPEDLRCLTEMLMQVTSESTFLSVRTGSQWRNITGLYEVDGLAFGELPRIGLYNDGIMGNIGDLGSYSSSDIQDTDPMAYWSREKELEFQSNLCRFVPNGGEVVLDNPLNDFENAVATLKKMHISYLNYDYDKAVLDKWAAVTVEKGVYQGMDGLTYIQRHLGYRILINDVKTAYHPQHGHMIVDAELKNVGFAPLYEEKNIVLQVLDKNNQVVYTHQFDADIRQLYGGENSGDLLELHHEIPISEWPRGEFGVYLAVQDPDTGELLVLANEQSMTPYGYKIAGIRRS